MHLSTFTAFLGAIAMLSGASAKAVRPDGLGKKIDGRLITIVVRAMQSKGIMYAVQVGLMASVPVLVSG